MSTEIRPAVGAEAKLLTSLALRSKAVWGYTPEFMRACREELTVTPEKMADDRFHYFVCATEQELKGFYALARLDEQTYELEALFVEPDQFGSGIGRALMSHAQGVATSLGARKLIIQGDPNAEHFYQAMGAVKTGDKESASIPGRFLPLFELVLQE